MESNMATADERTQIAVLQTQMSTALVTLDQINRTLEAQERKYVLVAVYEPRILAIENKLNSFIARRWLQNTLSATLGSILTALIGYFVFSLGG
jgi:hypothetical protein